MADPSLQDTQQNIRIPLVNVGDSRLSSGNVAYYWDQVYVNCFPLVASHPVTGETDMTVSKRVGPTPTSLFCSPTTGGDIPLPMAVMGMTQLSDVIIAAFFQATTKTISIVQFRPSAGTTTLIGTIASGGPSTCSEFDKVYITEIMLTTTQVPGIAVHWCKADYSFSLGFFAQSGGVSFGAGTLTAISDVLYPANVAGEVLVGPMQQLNQYFYAMGRSGKIYQCGNPLNIVAWSSRIIETYSYPDKGVGIFRFKHHLVAFSDTTVEFFNDTGARGDASTVTSSLERTEQAFIKFGAISAKYVKNIDDILYWASSSDTTTTGVWKMEGYTPIKISTYKQDMILNQSLANMNGSGIVSGSLEAFFMLGQKHLMLNNVRLSVVPFVQNQDTSYPQPDDPYWSSTDFTSGLQPYQMCYCLDTKCWWHYGDCSETALGAQVTSILPCSYFNRLGPSDSYASQYLLKYSYQIDGLGMSYLHVLNVDTPSYYDSNITDPFGNNPQHAILSVIQTNTNDQGTIQRKFLRKLSLVMDTPQVSEMNNNIDPYIYISVMRDDSQGMFVQKGQVIYPIKQRSLSSNALATDIGTFSFKQNPFVQPTTQMTLEGWFFIGPSDFTSNTQISYPIQSWKSDNTSSSWAVNFLRNDPDYIFELNVAALPNDHLADHHLIYQTPKTNPEWVGWHHWTIQIDLTKVLAAKALLKIDGIPTAWTGAQTTFTSNSFITSSDLVTIGTRLAGAGGSNSSISMSNVRIWNGLRTDEELEYYKNDQTLVTGVTPNLLYNHLDGTNTTMYTSPTPSALFNLSQRTADLPKPMFQDTYANNCGIVNRTAFCILHKAPMSFRAKALELNMVQGSR